MVAPHSTLIIVLGSVNSRAFSFEFDGKHYHLLKIHQLLTIDEPDLIVETLTSYFKKSFDKVFVLGKDAPEDSGFFEATKLFSGDSSILVVDVGAKKTWLGKGEFGKVLIKKYDFGLGQGILDFLKKEGSVESIASWIPEQTDFTELENYLAQKSLYPGILPSSKCSLFFEKAAVTELLRLINWERFLNWEKIQKVILTGSCLGKVPKSGQAVLQFLNGAQPQGIFQVFLDTQQIFSALGGLKLATDKTSLSFFKEFLVNLGTIINLSHDYPQAEILGKLFLDLGPKEPLKLTLKSGEIIKIPFAEGLEGSLDLEIKKGVKILQSKEKDVQIEGGKLGVIIDARGRPLSRPRLNEEGREMLKKWEEALG